MTETRPINGVTSTAQTSRPVAAVGQTSLAAQATGHTATATWGAAEDTSLRAQVLGKCISRDPRGLDTVLPDGVVDNLGASLERLDAYYDSMRCLSGDNHTEFLGSDHHYAFDAILTEFGAFRQSNGWRVTDEDHFREKFATFTPDQQVKILTLMTLAYQDDGKNTGAYETIWWEVKPMKFADLKARIESYSVTGLKAEFFTVDVKVDGVADTIPVNVIGFTYKGKFTLVNPGLFEAPAGMSNGDAIKGFIPFMIEKENGLNASIVGDVRYFGTEAAVAQN